MDSNPWIMGGYFNLIFSLRENKGGRRNLDIFQESFRDFIEGSQFVDLETGNGWFTWNNRRGGEYHVASRLDRFLVSKDIAKEAREVSASVLSAAGSNHWPICLQWDRSGIHNRKPFKFEQFWLEHKYFKSLVQQWWQKLVPPMGSGMY